MSPINGVYTWYTWTEFRLFLPAMSATVQVMTVVLEGHNTDFLSNNSVYRALPHIFSFIFST